MELLITNPAVLDSSQARYPGAWSFGHLMEQLAGPGRGSEFTLQWLRLWLNDQVVNGDTAPARPKMQEIILDAWRHRDQQAKGDADDPFSWTPNLENAPFKLIAIVNRIYLVAPAVVETLRASQEKAAKELAFLKGNLLAFQDTSNMKGEFIEMTELFHRGSREGEIILDALKKQAAGARGKQPAAPTSEFVGFSLVGETPVFTGAGGGGGYGSNSGQSGEGRMVFALTDQAGVPVEPSFTVIFEYALLAPTPKIPQQRKTKELSEIWAEKWHHLGVHETFNDAYLRDLVALTKIFTDADKPTSAAGLPVPPPLSQLRTNDAAFDAVREFRQFRFIPAAQPVEGQLEPAPSRLRQAPLSLTPADQFLTPPQANLLAKVLNTRIDNFQKEIPISVPTAVMLPKTTDPVTILGARALLPGDPLKFRWTVPGTRDARLVRDFSLHTCTGCHGAETKCLDGTHLRADAQGTVISAFISSQPDHTGELQERITILKELLDIHTQSSRNALIKLLHKRHRSSH